MLQAILTKSQDRTIRLFDEDDNAYTSYARVWFDSDGNAVIAEPYTNYPDGRHYYTRETDFDLID